MVPVLLDEEYATLVDKSLTTNEPCAPPCWQGLIPGESTGEDVMATLKDLPFVDYSSVLRYSMDELYPGEEFITWQSAISQYDTYVGRVSLIENGRLISIRTTLEYDLALRDLITHLGAPDVFTIIPGRDLNCSLVELIWLKSGIAAIPRASPAAPTGQMVNPDTLVESVLYFAGAANVEDYLTTTRRLGEEETQAQLRYYYEWDGFESVNLGVFSQE
jgi:hypothetical protein